MPELLSDGPLGGEDVAHAAEEGLHLGGRVVKEEVFLHQDYLKKNGLTVKNN